MLLGCNCIAFGGQKQCFERLKVYLLSLQSYDFADKTSTFVKITMRFEPLILLD